MLPESMSGAPPVDFRGLKERRIQDNLESYATSKASYSVHFLTYLWFPSVGETFMHQDIILRHREYKFGFNCLSGTSPGTWISERRHWEVGEQQFPRHIVDQQSVYTVFFFYWPGCI